MDKRLIVALSNNTTLAHDRADYCKFLLLNRSSDNKKAPIKGLGIYDALTNADSAQLVGIIASPPPALAS